MADNLRTLVPVTEPPTEDSQASESCDELFDEFCQDGTHPDYKTFEQMVQRPILTSLTAGSLQQVLGPILLDNIWDLIEDAVNGTGGFANGGYLAPHTREYNPTTKRLDDKFLGRCQLATYDNFVKPIVETPWNYIVQMRDMIERKPAEELDETMAQVLQDFWNNADGRGTEMTDFMEYPAGQARRYGTGWIVVDRPDKPFENANAEQQSAVYAYCVPTRNVLYWKFDDDYKLIGVAIKEPWAEVERGHEESPYDVRVWTPDGWAVYRPPAANATEPDPSWGVAKAGPNLLGEVPIVQLFDEDPGPGKGFGNTVTPTISKLALTCYNQRSEIREIQRNTGFPFLAVPMRNAKEAAELVIGTQNILGYDGTSGGPPIWVTQALTEATAIREDMDKNKEAAFGMAHMSAIMGWVQTSSGFHAETEFDKTNRRIGKFAASCESAENKIARLVLRYNKPGAPSDQVRQAVSITYPRDFGLRDIDAIVARAEKRVNMVLGEEDAAEAIYDMYAAQYPRLDKEDLKDKAKAAAAARYKATGGAPPSAVATVPEGAAAAAPIVPGRAALGQLSTRLQAALATRKQAKTEAKIGTEVKTGTTAKTGTPNGSVPPKEQVRGR